MSTANQQLNTGPEHLDGSESAAGPAKGGGAGSEATGNVDKIRGILFGSQMRDYEKKFLRVEERLGRETAELREEIKRLTEAMEHKHKALAGALEKEGRELRAALTDRQALADLFAEVAMRLKNEIKVAAKK